VSGCTGPLDLGASEDYSCRATAEGTVECWGYPGPTGSAFYDSTPSTIAGIDGQTPATTALEVAVARVRACALMADRSVMCWGTTGATAGIAERTEFDASWADARTLTADSGVACGVLADGKLACWGSNANSRLGLGLQSTSTPILVEGVSRAIDVVLPGAAICALIPYMGSTAVTCWGKDTSATGCLETECTSDSLPPPGHLVKMSDGSILTDVETLAAGSGYACAIRRADASIVCWGIDNRGQLGDGCVGASCPESAYGARPVQIDDGLTIEGFIQVSPGRDHTCAITNAGRVACWGENEWGQLGHSCTHTDTAGCNADWAVARLVRHQDGTPFGPTRELLSDPQVKERLLSKQRTYSLRHRRRSSSSVQATHRRGLVPMCVQRTPRGRRRAGEAIHPSQSMRSQGVSCPRRWTSPVRRRRNWRSASSTCA